MGNRLHTEAEEWAPYIRTPSGALWPRALAVLHTMATYALDEPKDGQAARRYYRGHDHLVYAIGLRNKCDPKNLGEDYPTRDDRRAITDAISALVCVGALTRVKSASTGHNAEYELQPPPRATPFGNGEGVPVARKCDLHKPPHTVYGFQCGSSQSRV